MLRSNGLDPRRRLDRPAPEDDAAISADATARRQSPRAGPSPALPR
jgi:hypothetical protein